MKKVEFLRLVCSELAQMGVGEDEIKIQCRNTDRYITSMGVGEESSALDREDPAAFAKLIYSNIEKIHKAQPAPVTEKKDEPEFSDEMPSFETIETPATPQAPVVQELSKPSAVDKEEIDDVKIFLGKPMIPVSEKEEIYTNVEPEIPAIGENQYIKRENEGADELYNPFEETEEDIRAPETVNGTIEFDVVSLKKKQSLPKPAVEEEEDYFEKAEEDYKPAGNPALFWVLVCLTSFLWIPLGILFFVGIGLGVVLMILFEALYIPGLVGIIIGGSAVSFAELIYSIIKFAGKNPAVALFELGLGFLVAALTVGLPTVMYYLGVNIFPGCIKNYGKNVKTLMKKLRRLYRKVKGACSI